MKNKKKGISLIVLIITIVVIIILAAAVILTIGINNPKEWLKGDINTEGVSGKPAYPTPSGGSTFTDANGVTVPVPAGYTVSTVAGENMVANGLVIKEGSNGAASSYSVNEFVWIPLDFIDELYDSITNRGMLYDFYIVGRSMLKRDCLTTTDGYREPAYLTDADYGDTSRYNTAGITEALLQNEFNTMVASVSKYGGFYIGRYETGNLSQNTPVVRKLNTDIGNQSWYNMYTRTRNIVSNASGQTTIIWGCQWDVALRWMLEDSSTRNYVTNSEGKGNYKDQTFTYTTNTSGGTATKSMNKNTLIPTGSYEGAKVKNVYDMAGNVFDFTMEAYRTFNRVARGGAYFHNTDFYSASQRSALIISEYGSGGGVRVQLYLK